MKNHLTSLSGPELSSTYLSSLSGPELFSAKGKLKKFSFYIDGSIYEAARIKLDEAESSKQRSAFATEIQAAKARSRKPLVDGKELAEFQTMWSMKKKDLALKESLSKIKLLDTLIARQGTLADYEEETH
ncbi:hypothetical protein F2Q69_00015156 [Brassica cretica]|uniref:Uncharacterized protein n=1 Tax=Brassica cretica TaxID=69181 RepID=A0A8S9QW51_BRACR|nr:hypothetical protein F2Q69_00015156 [Brassica cretica]